MTTETASAHPVVGPDGGGEARLADSLLSEQLTGDEPHGPPAPAGLEDTTRACVRPATARSLRPSDLSPGSNGEPAAPARRHSIDITSP